MNAAAMQALTESVVNRFAEELAEADTLQLTHLAQRAEARYTSDLGARMRALVDAERSRRDESIWTRVRSNTPDGPGPNPPPNPGPPAPPRPPVPAVTG